MKIIVCIKQVPGTTAVEVDEKSGVLKRDGVESKMNPYDLFALETRGGFERIEGKERQFEVNPAEGWVAISGLWNFDNHLIISQSLNYRSDARWNLRYSTPLVVKGDWFWNVSLIQNFPSYGLTLSGTLLHIIGKDFFEVPGGGLDRTRFYCTIKKSF